MTDLPQGFVIDVHMQQTEAALGALEQACHDVQAANRSGDDVAASRHNAAATKALSDLTQAAQAMLAAATKTM